MNIQRFTPVGPEEYDRIFQELARRFKPDHSDNLVFVSLTLGSWDPSTDLSVRMGDHFKKNYPNAITGTLDLKVYDYYPQETLGRFPLSKTTMPPIDGRDIILLETHYTHNEGEKKRHGKGLLLAMKAIRDFGRPRTVKYGAMIIPETSDVYDLDKHISNISMGPFRIDFYGIQSDTKRILFSPRQTPVPQYHRLSHQEPQREAHLLSTFHK